jgi:hypothetical protein
MKRTVKIPTAAQSPRRVRLDDGTLVLPPVTLRDLPSDGVIGSFMGIAALRFATPAGAIAVFLHDLTDDDIADILAAQRRQAEAQLGAGYGRRALWWERS